MTEVPTSSAKIGEKVHTIGPNEQAVFIMDFDPRSVNITNNDPNNPGAAMWVWVYAAASAVTPALLQLNPGDGHTIRPVQDSSGNNPRTIVIFNTGSVSLDCRVLST